MNVDVDVTFDNPNDNGLGSYLLLSDPTAEVVDTFLIRNIKYDRFINSQRYRYLLIGGSAYVRYGSSEVYPLNSPNNPAEWVPISSPYTSSEWTDYVDNWNYSEDCSIRLIESTVFASLHFRDPVPANVSIKAATFSNTVTKSLSANSTLIVIKRSGLSCEINGEAKPEEKSTFTYQILEDQDVTVTVPGTFYLIYLQNV